jgi:hypothetical protein
MFWLGLLAVPALLASILVLWILYSLATKAWSKLHTALLYKINLAKDANAFGQPHDKPHTYEKSANKIRDALLASPRFHTLTGLGWMIVFIRDSKTEKD